MSPRYASSRLLELMDEGVIDGQWLAQNLIGFISEDDVREFVRNHELWSMVFENA
jgi:hypothetical protein